MIKEYEKFYAKLWETGDSVVITIPSKLLKGTGWKKGDLLKLMAQRQEQEEDE